MPVCLGLYRWQREALEAWSANDRRGVAEAVTGAGKTRVGLHAIAAPPMDPGGARDSAGGSDWSIG